MAKLYRYLLGGHCRKFCWKISSGQLLFYTLGTSLGAALKFFFLLIITSTAHTYMGCTLHNGSKRPVYYPYSHMHQSIGAAHAVWAQCMAILLRDGREMKAKKNIGVFLKTTITVYTMVSSLPSCGFTWFVECSKYYTHPHM